MYELLWLLHFNFVLNCWSKLSIRDFIGGKQQISCHPLMLTVIALYTQVKNITPFFISKSLHEDIMIW